MVQLTTRLVQYIIHLMKKTILLVLAVITLSITGCGVKSDLKRIGDFPRDYPVY